MYQTMDESSVDCKSAFLNLTILPDFDYIVPGLFEFQCREPGCNESFKTQVGLILHNRKHLTVSCKFCSCQFSTSEEGNAHIEDFHIPFSPLTCKKCSKISKSKNAFGRHVRETHRPKNYPCPHCGFKFNRPENLKAHIRTRHFDRDKNPNLQECRTCGLTFTLPRSLKLHIKYLHRDNQEKFKCGECGKEYGRPDVLRNHIRLQHSHNIPIFTCLPCKLEFKTREHFIRHCGCDRHKKNCKMKTGSTKMTQFKSTSLPKRSVIHGTTSSQKNKRRNSTTIHTSIKLNNSSTSKTVSIKHSSKKTNSITGKTEILKSKINSIDNIRNRNETNHLVGDSKVGLGFWVVDLGFRISNDSSTTTQLISNNGERRVMEVPIEKKLSKLDMINLLKCKNKTTWSDSHESVGGALQNDIHKNINPEISSSSSVTTTDNDINFTSSLQDQNNYVGDQIIKSEIFSSFDILNPISNDNDKDNDEESKSKKRKHNNTSTIEIHGMTTRSKRYKYFCMNCDEGFLTQTSVQIHEKACTPRIKYKNTTCKICGRVFNATGTLRTHEKSHSNNRPFICSYCPSSFKMESTRRTHEKAVHFGKKYKPKNPFQKFECIECQKILTTSKNLRRHISEVHHKFYHKCHLCEKKYLRELYLFQHIKRNHGVDNGIRYVCKVCDKTFKREDLFNKHFTCPRHQRYLLKPKIKPKRKYNKKINLTFSQEIDPLEIRDHDGMEIGDVQFIKLEESDMN